MSSSTSFSTNKGKGRALPEPVASHVDLPIIHTSVEHDAMNTSTPASCDCSMCKRRAQQNGAREGSWSDASSSTAASSYARSVSPTSTVVSTPPLTPESVAGSPALGSSPSCASGGCAAFKPAPAAAQYPTYHTSMAQAGINMAGPSYNVYASQSQGATFSPGSMQALAAQSFSYATAPDVEMGQSAASAHFALGKRRREDDDDEMQLGPSLKRVHEWRSGSG
ncbi:unnamed protein product [Peniophora sp. CBMAI 1063]|nr:unnamed protein product [Peniophora sp. CBMAI 1063]